MNNSTRAIVVAISLALVPLTVRTQNGPPSDRPGQGESHRSDPCANDPQPNGNAHGIEKRCALGASAGVARGDFNNDGFADLAVGVPDETRRSSVFDPVNFRLILTDHPGAGAVNIIYGSAGGLTTTGTQILDRGFVGNSDNAHFGRALASGKFRGPNFASDLAVGVPGARNSAGTVIGALYVFFSANGRLNNSASQIIFANQFSGANTVLGANVTFRFPDNMSMVWGDFNNDDVGDLVVELALVGNANARSAVVVLPGVAGSGLSLANHRVLVVDDGLSPNNFPAPDPNGQCARLSFCATSRGHVTLAAGDLDSDGDDDLLIGAPNCREVDDDGSGVTGSPEGCVAIVPGSPQGGLRQFVWSALVPGDADRGGGFGLGLAIGDFNGNGQKDVAVGAPESGSFFQGTTRSGAVRVFNDVGTGGGQSEITGLVLLTQANAANQVVEADDRFGAALAAKDFNADAFEDLAVGAPGESSGNNVGHGVVSVFRGSNTGLPGSPAGVTFAGPTFGVLCCWNGAAFGSSLTAWNFGLTQEPDLVIGSPFFTIQHPTIAGVRVNGAGSVLALYGLPGAGLTPLGSQLWTQNPGFQVCVPTAIVCLSTSGQARAGNHFGASLY